MIARRMTCRFSTFMAAAILIGASCGQGPRDAAMGQVPRTPATLPATRPAAVLEPIEYSRTGGFIGTNDHITISPSGDITVKGKILGERHGQLTPEQMRDVAGLFAGWDKLADNYPPPTGSADDFKYEIQYGKKRVRAAAFRTSCPSHISKSF